MTKNIRLLAAVLLIGIQKSSASFLPRKLTLATVSTLRGGGDNAASSFKFDGASQTGDDFIGTAYDWATNLGAPGTYRKVRVVPKRRTSTDTFQIILQVESH